MRHPAAAVPLFPEPPWRRWLPVVAGLLALFVPAWWWLGKTTWQTPENGHGPILLAVSVWLFWRARDALRASGGPTAPGWGTLLLCAGLALHVLGLSQGIDSLLVFAHLPILAGALLLLAGPRLVRAWWFPLLFLLFLVPLPGMVVELLTGALKREVSATVEQLLHAAGYPVARSGVVLVIGQYQLLVADACSGLNSLFTLAALSLLLIHVTGATQPRRGAHIVLLVLAILPIALVANVLRVLLLVLVTWYWGDEAGQGIAHGATGMLLFIVALGLLLLADHGLRRLFGTPPPAGARP